MKILVIPDIHEAPNLDEVEAAIAAHAPDLTVFLGDYFDSWDDTPADAGRTAEWLANSLKLPRRQHLFGNHDLPYYVPRIPVLGCPGNHRQPRQRGPGPPFGTWGHFGACPDADAFQHRLGQGPSVPLSSQ